MTTRLLLCTVLSLLFANISFSQTGAIKGAVTTSDGKHAGYVTITLKGFGQKRYGKRKKGNTK